MALVEGIENIENMKKVLLGKVKIRQSIRKIMSKHIMRIKTNLKSIWKPLEGDSNTKTIIRSFEERERDKPLLFLVNQVGPGEPERRYVTHEHMYLTVHTYNS